MENHQNKILLDARFWGPSHTGLGRYTQELVGALVDLKPKFDLAVLAPEKIDGVETIVTAIKPYSIEEQLYLPRLIKSINPDLVHFLHFNLPFLYNRPFVVTIHDLIKHHSTGLKTTTHWPGLYFLKRIGYHAVISHAVTKAQKIITPSSWVKQDILKNYPVSSSKISVTYEAANNIYFKKEQGSVLPYDYFIYVGNAYPHKNLMQLIKAIQVVAKDRPGIKLVIVTGRDWFYQRLRRDLTAAKAQAVVKLKDFTSDKELAGLYRHAQAYITASLYEGFGLPGLEAMASKTLVLASRRAALPEVYSRYAEYFNPQNIEEIAAKMKATLDLTAQERQKRINRAYKYCQSFSWKQTAEKTIKIYEDCLGL